MWEQLSLFRCTRNKSLEMDSLFKMSHRVAVK